MLEPYERKRSRTVLRRERASNRPDLADYSQLVNAMGGEVINISHALEIAQKVGFDPAQSGAGHFQACAAALANTATA